MDRSNLRLSSEGGGGPGQSQRLPSLLLRGGGGYRQDRGSHEEECRHILHTQLWPDAQTGRTGLTSLGWPHKQYLSLFVCLVVLFCLFVCLFCLYFQLFKKPHRQRKILTTPISQDTPTPAPTDSQRVFYKNLVQLMPSREPLRSKFKVQTPPFLRGHPFSLITQLVF